MKKLKQYLITIFILLLVGGFCILCVLVPIVAQITGGIIYLLAVYYLVELLRMVIFD